MAAMNKQAKHTHLPKNRTFVYRHGFHQVHLESFWHVCIPGPHGRMSLGQAGQACFWKCLVRTFPIGTEKRVRGLLGSAAETVLSALSECESSLLCPCAFRERKERGHQRERCSFVSLVSGSECTLDIACLYPLLSVHIYSSYWLPLENVADVD